MRRHTNLKRKPVRQPDAQPQGQLAEQTTDNSAETVIDPFHPTALQQPQRILALQRIQGNQAVQRTLKLQRHWVAGEPEDEEMKNKMGLQRTIAPNAPSIRRRTSPAFGTSNNLPNPRASAVSQRTRSAFDTSSHHHTDRLVQRNWLTDQFKRAAAYFGWSTDASSGTKDVSSGTKVDPGAKQADAPKVDPGVKQADAQVKADPAPVVTPPTPVSGEPKATPDAPKVTADQIKLNGLSFSTPQGIPADGATSTEAKVGVTPADRTLTWGFIGPDFGSQIDANGKLTPGNDTGGAESANLQVKASDSEFPTAFTTGIIKLYDAKVYKSVVDYDQFIKSGPYNLLNHTVNLNGKFDMSYDPAGQLAQVTVKVKYDFADDVANTKASDTDLIKKERQERQDKYRQTYHDMIVAGWSKRYQFQNIHEPKSVWGKLNPVTVQVNVQEVKADQHFLIQVKAANQAGQSVGGGVANMGPNLAPQLAFNGPNGTGPSELKRVEKLVPAVQFENNSADLPADAQGKLTLLAEYLRRMNNPKFKFEIVGHATATGQDAHNQELSAKRATAVSQFLKSNGVNNHTIETSGVGAAGAGAGPEWRKVAITSSLPAGWQNTQDVTLHEFGHMMGLGDEYVGTGRAMGAPATHYDLVKKAFGKDYADTTAKVDGDRASLMEGGDDIRMYHYVTFWDATVLAAAKAPAPVPAFTHDDWKFIG